MPGTKTSASASGPAGATCPPRVSSQVAHGPASAGVLIPSTAPLTVAPVEVRIAACPATER
eukprot:6344-Lingulodinium_polyedra.AAC.1